MLMRIQRQVHRNPTLGVLMTLALWWTVTCLVAYSLRSSGNTDVDEIHPLRLPEEREISSQQRENLRRQRFLRRNRHVNEDHSFLKRHSASQDLEIMKNTTELHSSLKELFLEHEKLTGLRPTKPRKRHQFFNKLHLVEENINLDNISQSTENFWDSNRHLLSIRSKKTSDFNGISYNNYDFKKYVGSGRRLLSTRTETESEIYGEPAGNYGFMTRNGLIKNDETSFFVHTNPDPVTWRTLMNNVCEDIPEPQSYHINISSLVKHIETIIKILVFFSRSSLKVIFITETRGSYDLFLHQLNDWPTKYRSRLQLQRVAVPRSPARKADDADEWNPCQWSKLLMLESLPEKEGTVVYLEGSIIFLAPMEAMWEALRRVADPKALTTRPNPRLSDGQS